MEEIEEKKTRTWLRALPVLLWMGVIFFMSAQNGEESGALSEGILEKLLQWFSPVFGNPSASWREAAETVLRKLSHATEYGVLAVLWCYALAGWWRGNVNRLWLTAFLLTVAYAGCDEWHQTFVPGRVGSVVDVGIDAIGAAVGIALAAWHRMRRRKKNAQTYENSWMF